MTIRYRIHQLVVLLFVAVAASLIAGGCGDDRGTSGVEVPTARIVIDGDSGDWTDIEPLATDAEGDDQSSYSGADLAHLFVAYDPDRDSLYIMVDLWDGSPNPLFASRTTDDGDQTHLDVEMGYQVFLDNRNVQDIQPRPKWELFARYDTLSSTWIVWAPPLERDWILSNIQVSADHVLEWGLPFAEVDRSSSLHVKTHVNTSAFTERREKLPKSENWVTIQIPQ